jgi:hypothetical protein
LVDAPIAPIKKMHSAFERISRGIHCSAWPMNERKKTKPKNRDLGRKPSNKNKKTIVSSEEKNRLGPTKPKASQNRA